MYPSAFEGPVAQPGRVPDFYPYGRNPAVSGSTPDGPVVFSGSPTNESLNQCNLVFEEYDKFKKVDNIEF